MKKIVENNFESLDKAITELIDELILACDIWQHSTEVWTKILEIKQYQTWSI